MRIKVALATGTCLAALSSVAACSGGNAEPKVLPTLAPTTSATPTSAPVEVPAAARARTPEGADAFVHFFFDEMNEAFKTSDGDRIRRLTNGECETCENYAKALDAARREGHYLRGDSFRLLGVAAPPLEALGVIVDVTADTPARTQVDSQGVALMSVAAEGRIRLQVAVKWVSGVWRTSGIRRAQ